MNYIDQHILVGKTAWMGGFITEYVLTLEDHHRPVWVIQKEKEDKSVDHTTKYLSVIPHLSYILESGLIAIAYEIIKDEVICEFLHRKNTNQFYDFNADFTQEEFEELLSLLTKVDFKQEIVVMGFPEDNIEKLKAYKIKGELLVSHRINK